MEGNQGTTGNENNSGCGGCLIFIGAIILLFIIVGAIMDASARDDAKAYEYQAGITSISQGDYDKASMCFVNLQKDRYRDSEGLYSLACALESNKKGDYSMALYYLKKVDEKKIAEKYPDLKEKIEQVRSNATAKEPEQQQQKKKEEAQRQEERESHLYIGDPEYKIEQVLGAPRSKNITRTGNHESIQWVYPNGTYIYTDDGVVTAVQTSE